MGCGKRPLPRIAAGVTDLECEHDRGRSRAGQQHGEGACEDSRADPRERKPDECSSSWLVQVERKAHGPGLIQLAVVGDTTVRIETTRSAAAATRASCVARSKV